MKGAGAILLLLAATLALLSRPIEARALSKLERVQIEKGSFNFLLVLEKSHTAVVRTVDSAGGDIDTLAARLSGSVTDIRNVGRTLRAQVEALQALDWRLATDTENATPDEVLKTWMRAQSTLIVALSEVRAALTNASSPTRTVVPYLEAPPHPSTYGDWASTSEAISSVAKLLRFTWIRNVCDQRACSLCLNGGTCVVSFGVTYCKCAPGFNGSRCEVDIDDCASNPCRNGGLCFDRVNNFECSCRPGWSGKTCDVNIDDCLSNPCKHKARCVDGINSFTCVCPPGFSGNDCSVDINDCASNPCKNDAICLDLVNAFMCQCPPGFSGQDCGTNIDDCSPNPCKNDGKCVDEVNGFKCSCPPGFEGKTCETNVDDCASGPCKNGASCIDGVNSVVCKCAPGFSGDKCQTDIDDCASNPCKNGATCVDGLNSFVCKCARGFEGTTCEVDSDDCASKPCKNSATCVDKVAAYQCNCKPGFNGTDCEINVDDCASSPCKNGATCIDGIASFVCKCPAGYDGRGCENEINMCASNPCKNDGICTSSPGKFTCKCPPGFTGESCEEGVKCAALEAPAFGAIKELTNKGKYPSTVTFACNPGYASTDAMTRTCRADGTWSISTPPTCAGIICQTPPNIQFGAVTVTNDGKFPSTASYACSPGYTTQDATTRACNPDGTWSGTEPKCAGIPCAALSNPRFATVTTTNKNVYPSRAVYKCDPGYTSTNEMIRDCTPDGTWSSKEPVCEAVRCATLPNIPFGSVTSTNNNLFPSDATYTCETGYSTKDPVTRKCLPDGSWSGSPPACVGAPCSVLVDPSNGGVKVSNNGIYPSTATYKCNDGFTSADPLTRVCRPDGSWSNKEPSCVGVACQTLPMVPSASIQITNNNIYPSTATYKCADGFATTDPTIRTCNADGSWSGQAPSCKGVTCAALTKPDFASVSVSNQGLFPSVATYKCDDGYTTTDMLVRRCLADGSWDGKEPVCTGMPCGSLPTGSVYTFTTTNGGKFPSTATYTCNDGFTTTDPLTRSCKPDGTWGGLPPNCQGKPCAPLPPVEFGSFSTTNQAKYPSVATYTCNTGYTTSDPIQRSCKVDGSWDGKAPACVGAPCGILENPIQGTVTTTNTNRYPSTATYSCKEGYSTSDPTSRTCQPDGTWTGQPPRCSGIKCSKLPELPNGYMTMTLRGRFPSVSTYACNAGFNLVGAGTRACNPDGSWTGEAARCVPVACQALGSIPHGTVAVSSTVFPSSATYTCDPGYVLSGASSRVCNPDGSWASKDPVCEPVACPPPPVPADGAVSVSSPSYPSTATYKCNPGYDIVGSASRLCSTSGSWAGTAPVCQGIPCPAPPIIPFGSVVTTSPTFPSTATYSCKPGLNLNGAANRKCMADGTWDGIAPTCGCSPPPPIQSAAATVVNTGGSSPSTATYKCDDKSIMDGNAVVACTADGLWPSDKLPTCISKTSCKANPCKNDATCNDKPPTDYECKCKTPFFQGKDCETELDYLTSDGANTISADQYIRSSNKAYFLHLNSVGVLTLFKGSDVPAPGKPASGAVVWTNSVVTPREVQADPSKASSYSATAKLNPDCSLVVTRTANGQNENVWSIPSVGTGACKLLVLNTGGVNLYLGTTQKWCSTSNGKC